MLNIIIVDKTASSRSGIVDKINSFVAETSRELNLLPHLNIKPISLQEVRFYSSADICIVGEEIIETEITQISAIKKSMPQTSILVLIDDNIADLFLIEQLARLGVDDVVSLRVSASEFLKKIILLSSKTKKRCGKLVLVTGGKGGCGVTTVAAGMAECLVDYGKKVALVDLDFTTQDLSRFIQAKPFINENLQMLFNQTRSITEESVMQCLTPVWSDDDNLYCMPPIAECDDLYNPKSTYPRTLISIFEVLDSLFDVVIVDTGSAKAAFLATLYRIADNIAFIINNDPASLCSAASRLSKVRQHISPQTELTVVDNNSGKFGLKEKLLQEEFMHAVNLCRKDFCSRSIPFHSTGMHWPGTGSTIYSNSNKLLRKSFRLLMYQLKLIEQNEFDFSEKISFIKNFFTAKQTKEQKMLPPVQLKLDFYDYDKDLQNKVVPLSIKSGQKDLYIEEDSFMLREKVLISGAKKLI